MHNFILVASFIAFGMVLRHFRSIPSRTPYVLNMIAIYICVPALILANASKIVFSGEALVAAVTPWGLLAVSVALVLAGARMGKWPKEVVGVLLLVVPLGNTSFLGVPVIRAFFGPDALPDLILYDQIGTTIIFATYGSLILSLYGKDTSFSFAAVAKKMFLFPPSVALAVGLASRTLTYPGWFLDLLHLLAVPLVPMVMIAIGLQFKLRPSRHLAVPLGAGLGIKMVVAPLAVALVCRLIDLKGRAVGVSIVEAGMPPMVTAGALAVVAGMEAELATSLVGVGILCAFASLPVLRLLATL